MPLRLRSAGGGSVLLKPPVAQAADVSMEVPAYDGAKLLTDKTPGTVLQVVQVTNTTQYTSTSTTLVDTGFSATITPKFASSKILVLFNGSFQYSTSGGFGLGINRNGLQIFADPNNYNAAYFTNTSNWRIRVPITLLDSPNTTNACTYLLRQMAYGGTLYLSTENSLSTFTLMEIAG